MRAVVCKKYGSPTVLQLKELPKPVPKDNEVRVKNFASAVTGSDVLIRSANFPFIIGFIFRVVIGFSKPRKPIMGIVFSGEIESVGKNVKRFKKGEQIYGFNGSSFGAYAEYLCVSENQSKESCLVIKPASMSYEEAAAVAYGGVLAPFYLEKGNIKKGQKVLIYGASGAFGTTSVQLAKKLGAEVTGVCSTGNVELVKLLGADKVIDYKKDNFTAGQERYDFILDTVPHGKIDKKKLKTICRKMLSSNGEFASINEGTPKVKAEYLIQLNSLFEKGDFKAVIDRKYPLEQIVEAHKYVDTGRKKGNVIITVGHT